MAIFMSLVAFSVFLFVNLMAGVAFAGYHSSLGGGSDAASSSGDLLSGQGTGMPWGFIPWFAFCLWICQDRLEAWQKGMHDGPAKSIVGWVIKVTNTTLKVMSFGGFGLGFIIPILGPPLWWDGHFALDKTFEVLFHGTALGNATGWNRWRFILLGWGGLIWLFPGSGGAFLLLTVPVGELLWRFLKSTKGKKLGGGIKSSAGWLWNRPLTVRARSWTHAHTGWIRGPVGRAKARLSSWWNSP